MYDCYVVTAAATRLHSARYGASKKAPFGKHYYYRRLLITASSKLLVSTNFGPLLVKVASVVKVVGDGNVYHQGDEFHVTKCNGSLVMGTVITVATRFLLPTDKDRLLKILRSGQEKETISNNKIIPGSPTSKKKYY